MKVFYILLNLIQDQFKMIQCSILNGPLTNSQHLELSVLFGILLEWIIFDKKYYKQCDSVAKSYPMKFKFPNLFISHFEKIWLEKIPS